MTSSFQKLFSDCVLGIHRDFHEAWFARPEQSRLGTLNTSWKGTARHLSLLNRMSTHYESDLWEGRAL